MKTKQQNKQSSQIFSPVDYFYDEAGMTNTGDKYSVTYKIIPPVSLNSKYVPEIAEDKMQKILFALHDFEFKFTVRNSYVPQEEYVDSIILPQNKEPAVNNLISNYNEMLADNADIGHNNYAMHFYLTLITKAVTPEEALNKFNNVDEYVVNSFKEMYDYSAVRLDMQERFDLFYSINHPDNTEAGQCKPGVLIKTISPNNIKFERDYIQLGDKYVRVVCVNNISKQVNNISDLTSVLSNSVFTINYECIDKEYALNTLSRNIKNNTIVQNVVVRDTIEDRKNKRTEKRYINKEETEQTYFDKAAYNLISDACDNSQDVFLTSYVIAIFADTLTDLDKDTDLLRLSANKLQCKIKVAITQQKEGFLSVYPSAGMFVNYNVVFNSARLAQLSPFNLQKLSEKQATLIGISEINDNFIMVDRSNYYKGLIMGAEKSGKTFGLKREAVNTLMSTDSTVIIITPNKNNEYDKLITNVNGAISQAVNTDLFTYDSSYNLNQSPESLKTLFLSSFMALRRDLYKQAKNEKEIVELNNELDKESKILINCGDYTSAVSYLSSYPNELPLFGLSLKGNENKNIEEYSPALKYSDYSNNRFNVITYNTPAELLTTLDYAWNIAITYRKANKNISLYIEGIDPLLYAPCSSNYLLKLLDNCEIIKVPVTISLQNASRIAYDSAASVELEYLLKKVDYFKLFKLNIAERQIVSKILNLPYTLQSYLAESETAKGVIITSSISAAFNDKFDSNDFYKML